IKNTPSGAGASLDPQLFRHVVHIDSQHLADTAPTKLTLCGDPLSHLSRSDAILPAPRYWASPKRLYAPLGAGASLDPQLLRHVVHIDSQHLADALLLHGHAIEDVRFLHGAPPVGDDDEL